MTDQLILGLFQIAVTGVVGIVINKQLKSAQKQREGTNTRIEGLHKEINGKMAALIESKENVARGEGNIAGRQQMKNEDTDQKVQMDLSTQKIIDAVNEAVSKLSEENQSLVKDAADTLAHAKLIAAEKLASAMILATALQNEKNKPTA